MLSLFHVSASVALLATALAVTRVNAVHALLHLIVSVLAAGGVMLSIGAPLAAALQVLLYAGAILVLFVFVVMLIHPGTGASRQEKSWMAPRHWIVPTLMSGLVLAVLWRHFAPVDLGEPAAEPHVKDVGVQFYGPYLLAVELGSFLLLAGLVSAWRIARPVDPK